MERQKGPSIGEPERGCRAAAVTMEPRHEMCGDADGVVVRAWLPGLLSLGSAALDLCHVACGRFEGFWEEHLKPWDTAAGMLIAREAGAKITDFSNRPYTPESLEILATNGYVHEQMLELLTEKPRGG